MFPSEPSPEFPDTSGDPVSKDPVTNIRKLMKKQAPKASDVKSKEGLWRGAALVSFVINILFLGLILLVGSRVLSFKSEVAEPLLDGVYKAVDQMDDIQIQTDVKVSGEVPVAFDLPLQRETTVTLSQPTRIDGASLSIRSATFSIDAPTVIVLPAGAELPITLDLSVPVNATVPVELTVPVTLSLTDSNLEPTIKALQDLIEPYKQLAEETPDCWQMLLWGGACP
jgi:hypothetical protein